MKPEDVFTPDLIPSQVIRLTVNGRDHDVLINANWTLSFVLRDKLGADRHKDRMRPRSLWRVYGHHGWTADPLLHDVGR